MLLQLNPLLTPSESMFIDKSTYYKVREKVREFVKEEYDLYYHDDGDGFCSGFLFLKFLERENLPFPKTHGAIPIRKNIKFKTERNIIFLDLAYHNNLDALPKKNKILFIDHHPTTYSEDKENIVLFEPKTTKNYPASKFIYDIFQLYDYDYVALIGLISDSACRDWNKFCQETMQKYNITKEELMKISTFIYSHRVFEEEFDLSILEKKPREILKMKEIKEFLQRIEEESKKINIHELENVLAIELTSDYDLLSYVANKFMEKTKK